MAIAVSLQDLTAKVAHRVYAMILFVWRAIYISTRINGLEFKLRNSYYYINLLYRIMYQSIGDRNDNDPAIYPGAAEVCDRNDNDCNPVTPESCALGCPEW